MSDKAKYSHEYRDLPLAILAWVLLTAILGWLLVHIGRTILLFLVAAFFAYALAPLVNILQKKLPRTVSILIVYLFVLLGIGILSFFIVDIAAKQFVLLAKNIHTLTTSVNSNQPPLVQTLGRFGLSETYLDAARQELTHQAEQLARNIVPLLGSLLTFIIDTLVVAIISIYLLITGDQLIERIQRNVPAKQRKRVLFFLTTMDRVASGYMRGQILLSALLGVFIGVGMELFHVPYSILLGALAFFFAFIPILGTFLSGAICVLLALTQGWFIALLVLGYFTLIHVLEADVLGPRIIGKAVGLHPLISMVALLAGTELFGIPGALFASPVAGIIQTIVITSWAEWRMTHEEHF